MFNSRMGKEQKSKQLPRFPRDHLGPDFQVFTELHRHKGQVSQKTLNIQQPLVTVRVNFPLKRRVNHPLQHRLVLKYNFEIY